MPEKYDVHKVNKVEGDKIENILKSVRDLIDNHNTKLSDDNQNGFTANKSKFKTDETEIGDGYEEEAILELTGIIDEKNLCESLISESVKQHAAGEINKFITAFKRENSQKYQPLELMINNLMRPLIKSWLDNNLPTIVEKIVSEEIKKIVPK